MSETPRSPGRLVKMCNDEYQHLAEVGMIIAVNPIASDYDCFIVYPDQIDWYWLFDSEILET